MNRRSFLKGLFFISSIFTIKLSASSKNNVSFDYGVASGDPSKSSVIIWTKVTPSLNRDIKIKWQISSTKDFKNILNSGSTLSKSSNDFTVKEDVLIPNAFRGKKIFYRFFFNDTYSDIGVTNTLPSYNPDQYNIAFSFCSSQLMHNCE